MEKWRTGHMMWHATTTIVFWMYLLCRFCSFLLYNFCVVYIKVTFFFFAFFFILHLCMSVFVLARFDFVFLTFASLSRQCAWRDTQNLLIQIVSPIWATHTVHEEHTAQHSTSNTQHTHDMHNRQTIPHIRCGRFQKWIARCARENRLRRMLSIAVWIWM